MSQSLALFGIQALLSLYSVDFIRDNFSIIGHKGPMNWGSLPWGSLPWGPLPQWPTFLGVIYEKIRYNIWARHTQQTLFCSVGKIG